MRLLNVETFKLREFFYEDPPPYAILSHTWGKDSEEVSYRDVLDGKLDSPRTRPLKITGCCKQAKADGYQYVWIDTCCIDKSNSVELQEAINSMFRWYQNAAICYAFLSDVPAGDDPQIPGSAFFSSRWFQRGWTLQELLAPLNFRFYDAEWGCMGTKGDLCDVVEQITGIPTPFLLGIADLHHASVAQRMSWVAKRATKRQEDIAYCLLGIFGIFMPLIYGEGNKAFRRLQEQIMKDVGDDSIFAWGLQQPTERTPRPSRVALGAALAPAPLHFKNSGQIAALGHPSTQPFDLHGGSLRLSVALHTAQDGQIFGLLKCGLEPEPDSVVGVPLVAAPGGQPDHYVRQEGCSALLIPNPIGISATTIHLHLDGRRNSPAAGAPSCWFHIRKSAPSLDLVEVIPRDCWHKERALIEGANAADTDGTRMIFVRFRDKAKDSWDFAAVLEIDPQAQARCDLMIVSKETSIEELKRHSDAWKAYARGQESAGNGATNLRVELEALQPSPSQRRFVVKLRTLTETPSTTIDATNLLQVSAMSSLLRDFRQTSAERKRNAKELEDRASNKRGEVAKTQEALDTVRAKIRSLAEEERRLVEEQERKSNEERLLLVEHHRVMQQEKDASHRAAATQHLLDVYENGAIDVYNHGDDHSTMVDPSKAEEQMLPFAVEKGYPSLVRLLLGRGIAVGGKDLNGKTALHHAAAQGAVQLALLLITRGADVTASTDMGVTPLHLAAARGSEDIGRLLLDKGAEVNAVDASNISALHIATVYGSESFVRLLLSRGAHVAGSDNKGATPLHYAAERGFETITHMLLERRPHNITTTTKADKTPMQLAELAGHHGLARTLSDYSKKLAREIAPLPPSTSMTPLDRLLQNPPASAIARTSPPQPPDDLFRRLLAETEKKDEAESRSDYSARLAKYLQPPLPYPDSAQMPELLGNHGVAAKSHRTETATFPSAPGTTAALQMPEPTVRSHRLPQRASDHRTRRATMPTPQAPARPARPNPWVLPIVRHNTADSGGGWVPAAAAGGGGGGSLG